MKYSRYDYANPENMRRRKFAQPTQNDVRPVNPVLTNMSIGFKNENFLWEQMAPIWEIGEKSGTFATIDREFWFRQQAGANRAPEGPYLRTGYGITSATVETTEVGFEKVLGDVTQSSNQWGDDLETLDVSFLTNLMQLEIEKQVASQLFITGVWGTSNTLTGTNQWSDFANSDPIADSDTAKRTIKRDTGASVTKVFIGLLGWEKLKEHPLLLDKYKHTQTGILTEELVAAALGVPEIVVGDSVENTADENQVYVGADIWTDSALFQVVNPPALQVAASAYTVMWNEKGNIPWAVDSYREEGRRSNVNRVFTHLKPTIVSSVHGYLFLDLVA